MSEFGIPYMGSKAKIAKSICMKLPKADHFYDLFGGGFSMTHCMIKDFSHKYKTFHYNEIKSDVVGLVNRSIAGEFSYDRFKPEWISRDEFFKRKDHDAYVRCLWSFGNDQKGYLFGREIEAYKKSLHMAVVFNEFNDFAEKLLGFNTWPVYAKTIKQRRLFVRQKVAYDAKKNPLKGRGDLQQLERLEQLEQLQQLEQLERLGQLDRLEQLEQLQRLTTSSLSYDQVDIKPNSIIYCDIPYENTADYGNFFNRSKFLDWAANHSEPVYISEYNVSDPRFKMVYTIDKRSLLNIATKDNHTVKQEKLYWNGK